MGQATNAISAWTASYIRACVISIYLVTTSSRLTFLVSNLLSAEDKAYTASQIATLTSQRHEYLGCSRLLQNPFPSVVDFQCLYIPPILNFTHHPSTKHQITLKMADAVEKAPQTDTGNNDVERNAPQRRKPPKLRRREDPAPEPTGESREVNGEPSDQQASRASEGDTAPTGSDSGGADGYSSPPEPPATEVEDQAGPETAEQPSPRQTTVAERPKTAPARNWQRRTRGQRGNQELVPLGGVGDVGKTVTGAVDSVQDVGSSAVRSAGDTVGKVAGTAVGASRGEEKGKEEQLRLRLDLNLDIEVQLKAKIHGDLTLQLLN
ncbi:hypothetical protein BJX96DRAFT_148488 [Aspergillus floccosus]